MAAERYSRLDQMSWWDRPTVARSRALVAGAGALANEVVKNLALIGWGAVTVVDHDHIEAGNLTRSVLFGESDIGAPKATVLARNASRLNPDCRVDGVVGDLRTAISSGMAARHDVVLGCLDNVAARLALSGIAGRASKLLVDGGLTEWEGTVSLFRVPETACYACGLTSQDLRELSLQRSCPAYARRAQAAGGTPTTPMVASATAAWMVQQALKWVHGCRTAPVLALGMQIRLDTAYDWLWKFGLPQNPECLLHPDPVVLADGYRPEQGATWREILGWWQEHLQSPQTVLHLPVAVLDSWFCRRCELRQEVYRVHVPEVGVPCSQCGTSTVVSLRNQVTGEEGWLDRTPASMGFAPWTWVTAYSPSTGEHVVELPGEGASASGAAHGG